MDSIPRGGKNSPKNIALSGIVTVSNNLITQQVYSDDNSDKYLLYYIRKGIDNGDTITWSKWHTIRQEFYIYTTIVKGYFGRGINSFNKLAPRNATSIIFTDSSMPSSATLIDVDEDGDGGVVAWLDPNDNTKMYVSTQSSGVKVEGNSNSDYMFIYTNDQFRLI